MRARMVGAFPTCASQSREVVEPRDHEQDRSGRRVRRSAQDDSRRHVRQARGGTPREISPQTFRQFAEVYKERHVLAKGLALAKTIDYRLKPLIEGFGDCPMAEIKTANIEDFIADLRKPRIVNRRPEPRTLTNASINRTIELLRH